MEIISSSERFKRVDGVLKVDHVQGIFRNGTDYYLARWSDRRNLPTDLSVLDHVQPLDTKRGPRMKHTWTKASAQDGFYLKTPSLWDYAAGNLEYRMRREIEMCEFLRKHPHPNVAVYHGCQETNGRATGLFFDRYRATLNETVNPGSCNKQDFASGDRKLVTNDMIIALGGLLDGIQHLHSLGIVHNDVNPSNIMFDENGRLVLIDFDSCRYVGEPILATGAKRTPGWHEHSVVLSRKMNDLEAFEEVK
ncbi:hypothetical protein VTI74DRAFT_6992 [Chaetomium olivicolor]